MYFNKDNKNVSKFIGKFIEPNKSFVENMSYVAVVLTLIYSIFQFNYSVWPVWEKNNDLENTLHELENKKIELENIKNELNETRQMIDEYTEQIVLLTSKNEEIQKEIKEKEDIIKYTVMENNSLKMASDEDYNIFKELINSYYNYIRMEIINKYTWETLIRKETFTFKNELIDYCKEELANRHNSEIKKVILENLQDRASVLEGDEDLESILDFFMNFYIELMMRNQ
jgi:hypothetical protein